MGQVVTRNRMMERARQQARMNPVDMPLMNAIDYAAALALSLFLMAVAMSAGYLAGGTP